MRWEAGGLLRAMTRSPNRFRGAEGRQKRDLVQGGQVHHNFNLLGNISILYRHPTIMTRNIISNENRSSGLTGCPKDRDDFSRGPKICQDVSEP